MRKIGRNKQNGMFVIEFALGFIVLFMFTMLIFETCRLTYICSVLDYATAEAARDARVQLEKSKKFSEYKLANCDSDYKDDPKKLQECHRVQKMAGNDLAIWYYAFIKENATPLWKIFTSENDYSLSVVPYKSPQDYVSGKAYKGQKMWDEAALAEYTVTYTYSPIMFRWSFTERPITRRLLIVQDTAMFRSKLKGE
ncbi:TadE/TadG family type IV pilus assembly protein [Vibrio tapetis]|uniref:TadE-like domain-containing protein n=1 Tax=Vibrio tapetis subsp. tapetis TaxID=1671868 RepID=A0A2N8ZJ24_9VIBR|nr:TadE family protein [Vibrio tapetis]SON51897.1 protein of unknown function [Vibrio tapetis subsp. tapetis]